MKATIKAISIKNNSILTQAGDEEKWLKVWPTTMQYVKKGEAELTFDEDEQTVKVVKMSQSSDTGARNSFDTKPFNKFPRPSFNDPKREQLIIRQSSLRAAVDYFNGIPIEKRDKTASVTEIAQLFVDWVNKDDQKTR